MFVLVVRVCCWLRVMLFVCVDGWCCCVFVAVALNVCCVLVVFVVVVCVCCCLRVLMFVSVDAWCCCLCLLQFR